MTHSSMRGTAAFLTALLSGVLVGCETIDMQRAGYDTLAVKSCHDTLDNRPARGADQLDCTFGHENSRLDYDDYRRERESAASRDQREDDLPSSP